MAENDVRTQTAKSLGFAGLVEVHQAIMAGKQKGVEWLLHRGLTARVLISLGYDAAGMQKLGYGVAEMQRLGFALQASAPPVAPDLAPEPEYSSVNDAHGRGQNIRNMIEQGYKAAEMRQLGVHIHHCKMAGLSARELYRLGFFLDELAPEYPPTELRMAGFNPRELYRFFSGVQMHSAGYTATEMRTAGFSIQDLRHFGYSDNHIIGAGYSMQQLAKEGMTKHVKERAKMGQ